MGLPVWPFLRPYRLQQSVGLANCTYTIHWKLWDEGIGDAIVRGMCTALNFDEVSSIHGATKMWGLRSWHVGVTVRPINIPVGTCSCLSQRLVVAFLAHQGLAHGKLL